MNYDGIEKPHSHSSRAFGLVMGSVAGVVFAFFGFLLAFGFAKMLMSAFPGITLMPSLCIILGMSAIPTIALARLARAPHATLGARTMGTVGALLIVLLTAGTIFGVVDLFPKGLTFYITPGPYERPSGAPASHHR